MQRVILVDSLKGNGVTRIGRMGVFRRTDMSVSHTVKLLQYIYHT